MATAFGLLIYLAAIVLGGNVLVCFIFRREERSRAECAGLVLSLGAGLLGLILFWTSLAGLKPNLVLIASIAFVFSVAQVPLWRRGYRPFKPNEPGPTRENALRSYVVTSCAVIVVCVLLVTIHALVLPVYEWDAFAIWNLKAKVLAHADLRSRPEYFHDPNLSFSHLDYPLMISFLIAGAYGAVGGTNEFAGRIIFPILYAAFALQMFSALRWKLERNLAWLLTALAVSVPTILQCAGGGTVDVALALYYGGAVFYGVKWIQEQRRADLLLSIFYSACMAFTKNEGIAFAMILAGLMLLFSVVARSKRQIYGCGFFLLGFFALHLPWLWWSHDLPRTHENYGERLRLSLLIENHARIGTILTAFVRHAVYWPSWGALWIVFVLAALAGYRAFKLRFAVALWLVLIAQFILYAAIFVVTPWNVAELLNMVIERLFVQALLVVVLLLGLHAQAIGRAVPES